MKYGYARVSTEDQNPALQLAALQKAGCKTVFKDEITGAVLKRPAMGYGHLLAHCHCYPGSGRRCTRQIPFFWQMTENVSVKIPDALDLGALRPIAAIHARSTVSIWRGGPSAEYWANAGELE